MLKPDFYSVTEDVLLPVWEALSILEGVSGTDRESGLTLHCRLMNIEI